MTSPECFRPCLPGLTQTCQVRCSRRVDLVNALQAILTCGSGEDPLTWSFS